MSNVTQYTIGHHHINANERNTNTRGNATERNANTRGNAVEAMLHLAGTNTQNANTRGNAVWVASHEIPSETHTHQRN
jgi:hypothetical protein